MPQWSPMKLDHTSLPGLLDAVQGRPMVVMPAIESGKDNDHPETPHWVFAEDFPSPTPGGPPAPGLVERIGQLVEFFHGRMHLWARLYDRTGAWRFAVQLLHVYSQHPGTTDASFARGFDAVAEVVASRFNIPIGFVLDTIGGPHAYVCTPGNAGPHLARTNAVLALNGFASEVHSGKVKTGPKCFEPDWRRCLFHDNNRDNLEVLADWKRDAVHDWARSGVPVILDVSTGMDGRVVWRKDGVGIWGDNLDYTEDRWRNWMSLLKGPAIRGLTVNTWNGYTEGWAVAPSFEHGETGYRWLQDLLEPDPRHHSHMHYVNGAPTYRVYGAIAERWKQLGADRGFGVPVTNELASAKGRVSFFWDGAMRKAIYWSGATGARAIHGLIARTYWEMGADASRLGLPTSEEMTNGAGRVVHFEGGRIEWTPGALTGTVIVS